MIDPSSIQVTKTDDDGFPLEGVTIISGGTVDDQRPVSEWGTEPEPGDERVTVEYTIKNAFEAYWFLHEHPALRRCERTDFKENEPCPSECCVLYTDRNGNKSWEWKGLEHHALDENLDIHYARVDETRRVNDDDSKNTITECWLEFGQVYWGYGWEGDEGREYPIHCHEDDLNAGGDTFDEALIMLANKVLAKYGDYEREPWQFE